MASVPYNDDGHAHAVATGETSSIKPQTGIPANSQSLSESSLPQPASHHSPPPSDQKLDNAKSFTRRQQAPDRLPSLESNHSHLSPGNSQPSATHESIHDSHQAPFVAPNFPSTSQEKPSDAVHDSTSHQPSLDSHGQSDNHSHPSAGLNLSPASLETPTTQHQPLNSQQHSETTHQPKAKHKKTSLTFKFPLGSLDTSSSHDQSTKQKSSLTSLEATGQSPAHQQLPSGSHHPSSACQQPSTNSKESSTNHQPPSNGHLSSVNGSHSQPPSTGQQHLQQPTSGNQKSSATHQPSPASRRNVENHKPSSSSLQAWVAKRRYWLIINHCNNHHQVVNMVTHNGPVN
ncbi:hypothetical protein LINPERHAP1_LOCUS26942 [Linum perenne]